MHAYQTAFRTEGLQTLAVFLRGDTVLALKLLTEVGRREAHGSSDGSDGH